MGIPLLPPGERIRRLGEACEIYQAALHRATLTDFDGRYYQLKRRAASRSRSRSRIRRSSSAAVASS